MLTGVNSLLVVCAHADDEVLGAAGTMSLAARRGAEVHVVVLSTSVHSRRLGQEQADRVSEKRRRDARNAAGSLGASIEIHDLPDNGFDNIPRTALNAVIERAVNDRKPDLVLTHWAHDLNVDHQRVASSVLVACRPVDGRSSAVMSFEVRSSTDWTAGGSGHSFSPSVFVGLDDDAWEAKQTALSCYEDELRPAPHARSREGIDALARFRGTQVGLARAEAFVLLRSVLAP